MKSKEPENALPEELLRHYESVQEARRLEEGASRLEMARTREILKRFLPPPPAVILDVGGGPGAHALWLAGLGYEVYLVDAVPRHVEQALEASLRSPGPGIAGARVADARRLPQDDLTAHIVLLLGPLYHLTERAERVAALSEARRVLREDGIVLAAAISRYASLLDGLFRGMLDDPRFAAIVVRDLLDGQHRNPTERPDWFTTAYFHRPAELKEEMEHAGLVHEATIGIEGPAWLLQNFEHNWAEPGRRDRLLAMMRAIEEAPEILGASAHLMAVGRRRPRR
ncbi:MAG TPA: class I SAM-dependent methyltransferase [Candidatus Polarisedimenticolia bacterium]